jgi:hypothetical protein
LVVERGSAQEGREVREEYFVVSVGEATAESALGPGELVGKMTFERQYQRRA